MISLRLLTISTCGWQLLLQDLIDGIFAGKSKVLYQNELVLKSSKPLLWSFRGNMLCIQFCPRVQFKALEMSCLYIAYLSTEESPVR